MNTKTRDILSLVIVGFLIASLLFGWNTLLIGGLAIFGLLILVLLELRARRTHPPS
ncbi:DUF4175 domain-containing protein [Candidatus Chloroploca asiatica]|uniref:DUF4175 domain-containing protein n=1 Tax=Candidatus Chloroploca asiatica TaxID=1506545 RepID=UPI0011426E03|nr:DUF4175 domain-containing protein [Candidatus Chloroploca asiatica]